MPSDPDDAARDRQAALQAALARALSGLGESPPGFDRDRVRAAADSLAAKRSRGVARTWPGLASALGGGFAPAFAGYASATPLPAFGGPFADGHGFARALASRGLLPDAGRLEALAADLRFTSRPDGLVPRRGPWLVFGAFRGPRRLILAARWPGLGEWWLAIPLGRR